MMFRQVSAAQLGRGTAACLETNLAHSHSTIFRQKKPPPLFLHRSKVIPKNSWDVSEQRAIQKPVAAISKKDRCGCAGMKNNSSVENSP
jgi:hypothetical protein